VANGGHGVDGGDNRCFVINMAARRTSASAAVATSAHAISVNRHAHAALPPGARDRLARKSMRHPQQQRKNSGGSMALSGSTSVAGLL